MSTLNPLAEALSGLLVLAADRPRDEHARLIEQFLAQYPEIGMVNTIDQKSWDDQLVREWAGQAMQGELAAQGQGFFWRKADELASRCFLVSEAMLAEYHRRRSEL